MAAGDCLSLEDVAEGRKAVTDLMPRPGPRPAASMAGHLSIAVNQRHLAKLEIAVGAAQQLEHLRGRVAEPQETQSQRLQRRVDERLRRDGADAAGDGGAFAAHGKGIGGDADAEGAGLRTARQQGVGHPKLPYRCSPK